MLAIGVMKVEFLHWAWRWFLLGVFLSFFAGHFCFIGSRGWYSGVGVCAGLLFSISFPPNERLFVWSWWACIVVLGIMTLVSCFIGFAGIAAVMLWRSCFFAPFVRRYFLLLMPEICVGRSGGWGSSIRFCTGSVADWSLSSICRYCGPWVDGRALLIWG